MASATARHELRYKLQTHIERLSAKVTALSEAVRRAKEIADLRKAEQNELAELSAVQADFGPTLDRLAKLDWPTIGYSVNVGEAPAEVAAITADLSEAIQVHKFVLEAFTEGTEPSDALLKQAVQAQGLAARLHNRIEALAEAVSQLGAMTDIEQAELQP